MANRFNSVGFGGALDPTDGTLALNGKSVTATNLQGNAAVITNASGLLETTALGGHQVGGADQQIQYNNNGVFAGDTALRWIAGTSTFNVHGSTFDGNDIFLSGNAVSGTLAGTARDVSWTATRDYLVNPIRDFICSPATFDINATTIDLDATGVVTVNGGGTMTLGSTLGQEIKFDADGDLNMTGNAQFDVEVDGNAKLTSISDDVLLTAQSGEIVADANDHVVRANVWQRQETSTNFGATPSPTPTVAQLLTGILRGAPTTQGRWTLPTAATMVAQGLTGGVVNDAFEFVVVNEGTLHDIHVLTNTGVTLLGDMTVPVQSSGQFRVRLTNVTASTEAYTVYRISEGGGLPTGYLEGFQIEDSKVDTKTVLPGVCRDDTDTFDIRHTTNLTVTLSTPGAGGLDNGVEAANTWYYVFVIADGGGTNAVNTLASTNPTSPVMPAGYNKKRLIGAMRNDASSDLLDFRCQDHGRDRWYLWEEDWTVTNVLTNGSAIVFTSVSCGTLVPVSITTTARFNANADSTTLKDFCQFRRGGSTIANPPVLLVPGNGDSSLDWVMETDSSGNIEYRNNVAIMDTDVRVLGFQVHL